MKILMFMLGYFPGQKYGGPPVSIANFCSLMDGYDCYIVTHDHDLGERTPYTNIIDGWNDIGNAKVMYLPDKDYNHRKLFKIADSITPDLIYLQSLFYFKGVVPGLVYAKRNNTPVILAPRGELCGGAFNKKYKKIPYIFTLRILHLLNDVFCHSTSEEETLAINKYLGVSMDRINKLPNIPSQSPLNKTINRNKKSGEARLVFLSRIVRKKNLHSALKYLTNVLGDVTFDIYGPIEDSDYWNECKEIISNLPANISVEYCGLVPHNKVASIFSSYDAFLFPTLSENYGHVIAESLTNGCIPIISDQTPWNHINEEKSGWAIPLSNEEQFIAAINEVVKFDNANIEEYRANMVLTCIKKMNIDELKLSYEQFINSVVTNKK